MHRNPRRKQASAYRQSYVSHLSKQTPPMEHETTTPELLDELVNCMARSSSVISLKSPEQAKNKTIMEAGKIRLKQFIIKLRWGIKV